MKSATYTHKKEHERVKLMDYILPIYIYTGASLIRTPLARRKTFSLSEVS